MGNMKKNKQRFNKKKHNTIFKFIVSQASNKFQVTITIRHYKMRN
jgi:hypothetical protein